MGVACGCACVRASVFVIVVSVCVGCRVDEVGGGGGCSIGPVLSALLAGYDVLLFLQRHDVIKK